MPTALITGANGFIGSHLVRELLKQGYAVRGLVRSTSDLRSLAGLPLSIFIGDIRERQIPAAAIEGVDYIFHLAAALMVPDKKTFYETNTQGTINLLEATEKYATGTIERFLFVSSQAAAGPSKDQKAIDEQHHANPVSWYGNSKRDAELAVQSFAKRLPVTIVRPSAVYGEREQDISQIFPLVENRIHPKLGVLTKYTVMIYVQDLVKGIICAAESNKSRNKIYFLNHTEVLTTGAVVKTIAKAMDKPFGLTIPIPILLIRASAPLSELMYQFDRERPKVTRDKARELAERYWIASPTQAKEDFGWVAQHDLLQGMAATVAYFAKEKQNTLPMPLEQNLIRWLKYILCAGFIGIIIEIMAALGGFYAFTPSWGAVFSALGLFGLGLGTLAMILRTRNSLAQFIIGTLAATGAEALNVIHMFPLISWEFKSGWPFGVTNPWLRSLILGFAGGLIIVLVNILVYSFYKKRLRSG